MSGMRYALHMGELSRMNLDADGSLAWSAGDLFSATFGIPGDEPIAGKR